jgi:hypothetical protein
MPEFSNSAIGSLGNYQNYLNSNKSVLFQNAGDAAGNASSSGLDWFGDNGVIGSIGTGINAIGNIWNAYNSFTQGKKQLDLMEKANALAEKQYTEETRRYNEQKAEHDAATKAQQNTTGAIYSQFASNYQLPDDKKSSVVTRE